MPRRQFDSEPNAVIFDTEAFCIMCASKFQSKVEHLFILVVQCLSYKIPSNLLQLLVEEAVLPYEKEMRSVSLKLLELISFGVLRRFPNWIRSKENAVFTQKKLFRRCVYMLSMMLSICPEFCTKHLMYEEIF